MTKEQIIKLYIADLNNLVADSDAKRNRIMDLEDELEVLKQGQSLPIDIVSQQRELLKSFCKYIDLESRAHHDDIKIDIENHLKIFNCG